MRTSAVIFLLAFSALDGPSSAAAAHAGGPTCCDQCGRHVPCVETCQIIREVKKEMKTTWTVEYQDICPLMPGYRHGSGDCPPAPRPGHPKRVKKLVKKEREVEVPVYKCVVRYLCPDCLRGATAAGRGAGGSQPAAPPGPTDRPSPPPSRPLVPKE